MSIFMHFMCVPTAAELLYTLCDCICSAKLQHVHVLLFVFLLPDLVFRVNICLHSGAKLQLSFTYVTGMFHKLKREHNSVKVVLGVFIILLCLFVW